MYVCDLEKLENVLFFSIFFKVESDIVFPFYGVSNERDTSGQN